MGYNTNYEIEADREIFCGHKKSDGAKYCPECGIDLQKPLHPEDIVCDHVGYDVFLDSCKWYDHKQDMIDISKKSPGVLFTLYGDGEEPGDIWVKYFRNGKCQEEKAKIVYPKCKI